ITATSAIRRRGPLSRGGSRSDPRRAGVRAHQRPRRENVKPLALRQRSRAHGRRAMVPSRLMSHERGGAMLQAAERAIPGLIRRNTWLFAVAQAFAMIGSQLIPALGAIMVAQLFG